MTVSPEVVSALVGAFLPALVSIVVRSSWPGWAKGVTAVASSAVAGVVVAWTSGEFTGQTLATCVGAALAASQVFYATFWRPTGIGPAIERATQPSEPPGPPTVEAGGTGFQAELAAPTSDATSRRR